MTRGIIRNYELDGSFAGYAFKVEGIYLISATVVYQTEVSAAPPPFNLGTAQTSFTPNTP